MSCSKPFKLSHDNNVKVKWHKHFVNLLSTIYWKLNVCFLPHPGIPLLVPKRNECMSPPKTCRLVCKASLFTIVPNWKQCKCQQLRKDKLWYIHTKEYYVVIKKNKRSLDAPIYMNLPDIMLNERRQTQASTYYVIPFIRNSRTGKTIWW